CATPSRIWASSSAFAGVDPPEHADFATSSSYDHRRRRARAASYAARVGDHQRSHRPFFCSCPSQSVCRSTPTGARGTTISTKGVARMKFLAHGFLALGLVLASTGIASAKKCTDDAAVAAARAAIETDCPCADFTNHGQYVSCVTAALKGLDLPNECRGVVTSCAAKSTCGKSGAVTCCRIDKRGKVKCSIKSSLDKCKPPKGGNACAGTASSCCDSCGSG